MPLFNRFSESLNTTCKRVHTFLEFEEEKETLNFIIAKHGHDAKPRRDSGWSDAH
jgi:hypothetical protein